MKFNHSFLFFLKILFGINLLLILYFALTSNSNVLIAGLVNLAVGGISLLSAGKEEPLSGIDSLTLLAFSFGPLFGMVNFSAAKVGLMSCASDSVGFNALMIFLSCIFFFCLLMVCLSLYLLKKKILVIHPVKFSLRIQVYLAMSFLFIFSAIVIYTDPCARRDDLMMLVMPIILMPVLGVFAPLFLGKSLMKALDYLGKS